MVLAEYSGIQIDCDDLAFCKYIQAGELKKASDALLLTSPKALNIASIKPTPPLVWLITNNT